MGKDFIVKYLVIVKEQYYPSVFEFTDKDKAKEKFDSLIKCVLDNGDIVDDEKIYFCEIIDEIGLLDKDVTWGLWRF